MPNISYGEHKQLQGKEPELYQLNLSPSEESGHKEAVLHEPAKKNKLAKHTDLKKKKKKGQLQSQS